jgi:hypothetical protein
MSALKNLAAGRATNLRTNHLSFPHGTINHRHRDIIRSIQDAVHCSSPWLIKLCASWKLLYKQSYTRYLKMKKIFALSWDERNQEPRQLV